MQGNLQTHHIWSFSYAIKFYKFQLLLCRASLGSLAVISDPTQLELTLSRWLAYLEKLWEDEGSHDTVPMRSVFHVSISNQIVYFTTMSTAYIAPVHLFFILDYRSSGIYSSTSLCMSHVFILHTIFISHWSNFYITGNIVNKLTVHYLKTRCS